jgi:hypothetical protein
MKFFAQRIVDKRRQRTSEREDDDRDEKNASYKTGSFAGGKGCPPPAQADRTRF